MKKARVILAAIAVLAVTGASLAFTAKKGSTIYTTTTVTTATSPKVGWTITDPYPNGVQTFATDIKGNVAAFTFITTQL